MRTKKEVEKKILESVRKIQASNRMKEYFQFLSNFHHHSAYNTILIFLQKPDSSFVAGIKTWNKLGRRIKKGEHGISIFVPFLKKEIKTDATGEVEEEKLTGFGTGCVFDISQTVGGKEFKIAEKIKIDTELYDEYRKKVEEIGYPVKEIQMSEIESGSTDGKIININLSSSSVQKMKTLFHELSHIQLNHKKSSLPGEEVEAAAYFLMNSFEIDTSSYSFDYLAFWGSVKDQEFLTHLKTAKKCAKELEKLLKN